MIKSGEKLGKKWQIGLGDARYNANLIYVEGGNAGDNTVVCSVDGIWCHQTLDQVQEDLAKGGAGTDEVAKGLAVARAIVMVPDMLDFIEMCADGGNNAIEARRIMACVANGKPRKAPSDD